MKSIILLLCALALCILAKNPPNYNYAYKVNFDEAFIVNKTTYKVNGQFIYDPTNNRERVDRTNGRYDLVCGTVTPNQTTPCQQITVGNIRWVIFPNKSSCCQCCDASHGCGILRPDWLHDASYMGQDKLNDNTYDKWSKMGDVGYNYFWTTTDESQIPRRLDQNGEHFTDFNTHSFHNQTVPFAQTIFTLPTYCNVQSPALCPVQSACGLFRARGKLLSQE